jgi:hypothetical protein
MSILELSKPLPKQCFGKDSLSKNFVLVADPLFFFEKQRISMFSLWEKIETYKYYII